MSPTTTPLTCDAVETDICERVATIGHANNLKGHPNLTRYDWTHDVKQALRAAREVYDRQHPQLEIPMVAAAGVHEADQNEWLFDVSWLVYGEVHHAAPDGRYLQRSFRRLALAAESEWEPNDTAIIHDFKKLLVARCEYRVMVFNKKNTAELEATFDWLTAEIHQFHHSTPGDRYLLCGLNAYDTGLFEFRHVVV